MMVLIPMLSLINEHTVKKDLAVIYRPIYIFIHRIGRKLYMCLKKLHCLVVFSSIKLMFNSL